LIFDENINYLHAVAIQNDGKIVVAGQYWDFLPMQILR
jgi:hypothetical protein